MTSRPFFSLFSSRLPRVSRPVAFFAALSLGTSLGACKDKLAEPSPESKASAAPSAKPSVSAQAAPSSSSPPLVSTIAEDPPVDVPTPPSSPASAELIKACGEFATQACAKLASCFPFMLARDYGDLAKCTERRSAQCVHDLGAPDTAAKPADIAACTKAVAAAACEGAMPSQLTSCKLAGTRPKGAKCAAHAQCASGFCRDLGAKCGRCAERAGENGACEPESCVSVDGVGERRCCAPGFACHVAKATCVATAALGEACEPKLCTVGLECIGEKCVAMGKEGDTCELLGVDAARCNPAKGLDCVSGKCAVAFPLVSGVRGAGPCEHGTCPGGQCVAGKCVAFAALGASCKEASACGPDAICDKGKCALVDVECR